MKHMVKVSCALAMLLAFTTSAFGQITVTVTPAELPTDAIVNNPDDHYFIQSVAVVLDATPVATNDIVITLPAGVTLADTDNDGDLNDEIYWYADHTGAAPNFDAVGNTVSVITMDVQAPGGMLATETVTFIFPVETSATEATGLTYGVSATTGGSVAGVSNAVALDDTLNFATFNGTTLKDLDGGSIVGNDRGKFHPNQTANANVFSAVLADIIIETTLDAVQTHEDAGSSWLSSDAALGTANNDGEITFALWAAPERGLKRMDLSADARLISDIVPITEVTTVFSVNEGANISGHIDTRSLSEGIWYFYLNSTGTSDWNLASSDSLEIRHFPTLIDILTDLVDDGGAGAGFDFDHDGLFEPTILIGASGDDNASITLESGGTVGLDGALAGVTFAAFDTVRIFWYVDDTDDNARVHVFKGSVATFDTSDVVITSGVVTGLSTATELTAPAGQFENDAINYLKYDINPSGVPETSGTFYIYMVLYDGTNKTVYLLEDNANPGTGMSLIVKHFPFFRFQDYRSGDALAINSGTDQFVYINWGNDVDNDKDADASPGPTIKLYAVNDANVAWTGGATDIIGTGTVIAPENTLASLVGADVVLLTTILDTSDTQEQNRYMWDIRTSDFSSAASISIWATIEDGSDVLTVEWNSEITDFTPATPDDRSFVLTHGDFFQAVGPVGGAAVELGDDDIYPLQWVASNQDSGGAQVVEAFMVPEGTNVDSILDANAVAKTYAGLAAVDASTVAYLDGWYWIHSTTGSDNDGTSTVAAAGKFDFDVATMTNDMGSTAANVPSVNAAAATSTYDVYYFYAADASGLSTEGYVKSGGSLYFNGVATPSVTFRITPTALVANKDDIITFTLQGSFANATNVRLVNGYLDIPDDFLTVQDSASPFTASAFILDSGNGTEIENVAKQTSSGWELNFSYFNSSDYNFTAVGTFDDLATFKVKVDSDPSSFGFDDNLITFGTSGTRETALFDASLDQLATSVVSPGANLQLMQRGSISGFINMESRVPDGEIVDIFVSTTGSVNNLSDSQFLSGNSDSDGSDGIQVTLGAGGSFAVSDIPSGKYDVSVHLDGYANQLIADVNVYDMTETVIDFRGSDQLFGGDVAGYDHDGDAGVSTLSQPDNQIDATDENAILTAFGAFTADAAFNAFADIDEDGRVYIADLALYAKNTGFTSEGVFYKAGSPDAGNDDAVVRLASIDNGAGRVTYSVIAENLNSLRGYAVELEMDANNWELISFADGIANYGISSTFYGAAGSLHTFAGAINGLNAIREGSVELFTFTVDAQGLDPADPEIVLATLISGSMGSNEALIQNSALPTEFALSQNFPNPFNPTTNINFSIVNAGEVKLVIYNLLGREVATLVSGQMEPGNYTATWNARDYLGRQVSTGVYFYRLIANNEIAQTKKMLLLK